MENRFIISTSPHIRAPGTVQSIMWEVIIALMPAFIVAMYVFGWYAGLVVVVSILSAVITEAVIQKVARKPVTVTDGSAVLTGLLLAFVLPPNSPLYVPIVGAIVAIGIGKHTFGGVGHNIWNPALLGRAFLHFAFPAALNQSKWPILKGGSGILRVAQNITGVDVITKATPLFDLSLDADIPATASMLHTKYGLGELFLGNIPGCIGETSAIALLLGGLFLLYRKHINWRMPVFYMGLVVLMVWIFPEKTRANTWTGWFDGYPLYHMLAGGLMLGAFFMATDMVTSPLSKKGITVFALGAGILTGVIRLFGTSYPEGVCYSILLMNTATPLIDRYTRPRPFGSKTRAKMSKK